MLAAHASPLRLQPRVCCAAVSWRPVHPGVTCLLLPLAVYIFFLPHRFPTTLQRSDGRVLACLSNFSLARVDGGGSMEFFLTSRPGTSPPLASARCGASWRSILNSPPGSSLPTLNFMIADSVFVMHSCNILAMFHIFKPL
jgi:hypothetical protein